MGKCSNCGVYAHNIRTCPELIKGSKTVKPNITIVKTLYKTKKSCLTCNKKGHTFDTCEEFERIIPEYLRTWGLEAPSPIYPTESLEDAWIDVM